jgi:hypothetical protein
MRMILVSGAVVFLAVSTSAIGVDKSGKFEINKEKKEGTVNLSKDGTWKGGATEPPKRPEASMSEKDRREQQHEKGGQVFIRKTF